MALSLKYNSWITENFATEYSAVYVTESIIGNLVISNNNNYYGIL